MFPTDLYNVYAENIFQSLFNLIFFQKMDCISYINPLVLDSLLLKPKSKSIDKLGCFIIEQFEGLFYNAKYIFVELVAKTLVLTDL